MKTIILKEDDFNLLLIALTVLLESYKKRILRDNMHVSLYKRRIKHLQIIIETLTKE